MSLIEMDFCLDLVFSCEFLVLVLYKHAERSWPASGVYIRVLYLVFLQPSQHAAVTAAPAADG